MSKFLRYTAVALGITTMGLAWIVMPVLAPGHLLIYHWSGSPLVLFAPVFLDVLIVWLILGLLLLGAQRRGRWRPAVWGAFVLFAPSIVLKNLALLSEFETPHAVGLAIFSVAAAAYLLLLILWRPAFEHRFEQVVSLAMTIFAFLGISGALFLVQLSWLAWEGRSLNRPLPLHHSSQTTLSQPKRPRIIWIVLDELSYQQVYEHRYPGLSLPAFDSLAAEATIFSDVLPAGNMTEDVLPSLLTGQKADKVRSSATGQLSIHQARTGEWERFNQHNTVFQDALDGGYSTAVVGWWNPYCRIMPAVLDRCYWTSRVAADDGITPRRTVLKNMAAPIRKLARAGVLHRLLAPLLRGTDAGSESDRPNDEQRLTAADKVLKDPSAGFIYPSQSHVEDYVNIVAAADQVLDDPGAGFVLLHLPIPHPMGIYNRATGQLTTGASTYIDNLALADRYVAHVRSTLEQSGQWDSSTVIVMGDHGWRTTMIWMGLSGWTKEEQRASSGVFDTRPAYIVKLAGQKHGARINQPFRALDTRRLLDALIAGKIDSAEALSAWVQQVVATEPPQPKP